MQDLRRDGRMRVVRGVARVQKEAGNVRGRLQGHAQGDLDVHPAQGLPREARGFPPGGLYQDGGRIRRRPGRHHRVTVPDLKMISSMDAFNASRLVV